ncbi:hypothetical protein GOV12_04265 [Candidatus Pacearchaeota archaeon]|nr:hypothetical protein [Candidatus Pacearchaeota archaeon]
MDNYNQLLEFVSKNSNVSADDIERKVEAKRAKLAGLISREGALQIIAAELNISFDKQSIKISQVVPGMRKINIIGKIINLFPIREYNKNGRSGRIGSFVLADDTSNIRVVMWDENHIELIARGEINQDNFVELSNATLRNGEIHLTSFSEIKVSDKTVENIVMEKPVVSKMIKEFNPNDSVSTRAYIVQMFEPRFFNVCPSCKRKVNENFECNEHGKVPAEKRSLVNVVLDDGSDSIRSVMFSDQAESVFGKETLENPELFLVKKNEMLGKEMIVSGQVRRNALFNVNEFIINSVSDLVLDDLIKELEA